MNKAVIAGAVRTPIGRFGGAFSKVPAVELGRTAVSGLLGRTGAKPDSIDEVIMGHVIQAGTGQNPARQVSMASGIPESCPAFTVNKVCASGLKAVALAASAVRAGEARFIIAGGIENMSMAPFIERGARFGHRLGHGQLEDLILVDGIWDVFNNVHMGLLAECLAEKYAVKREEQDEFASGSQAKYKAAAAQGRFNEEIEGVDVKGESIRADEHPRETSVEKLAELKPAFKKDGTVTAGNSSGINDGACALLIADEKEANRRSLPVVAGIVDFVSAGLEPKMMGMGPAVAIKKLLERNGLTANDLDLLEINEAFASQMIAVNRELELDESRLNVNGGAIALGHPIGASGARLVVTLVHELARRGGRLGAAALCIGGGMGMAMLVERR